MDAVLGIKKNRQEVNSAPAKRHWGDFTEAAITLPIDTNEENAPVGRRVLQHKADMTFDAADLLTSRIKRVHENEAMYPRGLTLAKRLNLR